MVWRTFKVEQQRLKAIQAYMTGQCSMTDICKEFDISRKTAYKWYNRFLEYGEEGLKDLSRAPHKPNTLYSEALIDQAIDLKLEHKTWGPKKIISSLKEAYPSYEWPSPTRLYEIFKDHHLVTRKKIRGRVPATAPLGHIIGCNDTWAVDLKGWFLTGDGSKCEPLTITDCHSRYLIRCVHLNKHSSKMVWPVFREAFLEYGLPIKVRSDNGPPFGSIGAGRLTGLSINLIKAGVTPEWIRPGHPEENGRHERFHLTLKQDTANPPAETLALQKQSFNRFHHIYNYKRPHEALDMKTPGSCYQSSVRTWDGVLRSPEYDTSKVEVRKVCSNGCIWLSHKDYYIGEALKGEFIGLKLDIDENFEAYYGPVYLGKIAKKGFEKPKIKNRRPR